MTKLITIVGIFILSAVQLYGQAEKRNHSIISIGVKDQVYSRLLSENRELNIYLPDGYNPSDTVAYPVIYLLDGGLDEDFIHIVGLVQFNTFPWVNRLPKSIVVGIVNKDRKRDFTFPTTVKADKQKFPATGGASHFISFLEQELQPYIQSHYKVNNNKTIIGESLGGLLVTEILFEKPEMFNKYIVISPSLWWDNGSILKKNMVLSVSNPANKTSIYIGVGKEGIAPSEEPHVMEVDANVLADKIKELNNKNITLYFDYLPEETHATIAHQAVLNAFKFLGR